MRRTLPVATILFAFIPNIAQCQIILTLTDGGDSTVNWSFSGSSMINPGRNVSALSTSSLRLPPSTHWNSFFSAGTFDDLGSDLLNISNVSPGTRVTVSGDPAVFVDGSRVGLAGGGFATEGDWLVDFSSDPAMHFLSTGIGNHNYPALSGGEVISVTGSGTFDVGSGTFTTNFNVGSYSHSGRSGLNTQVNVGPEPSSLPLTPLGGDTSLDEDVFTLDVCPSTRAHFRNDWSLIFPLKKGRLMLAWCEYYATRPSEVLKDRTGDYSDAAACRISAKISSDKGRTWSDTFTLQDNTARLNVKHQNLLRLASDPNKILFFYTSRFIDNGDIRIFMKQSSNECETWSKSVQMSTLGGTHFLGADKIFQLPGGRIVLPVFQSDAYFPFDAFCYYSDDDGATWHVSKTKMKLPGHGAQAPTIVLLESGSLLAVLRTSLGTLYKSYSHDQGENWTQPVSTGLASPAATPILKRFPDSPDLLLIWNNIYDPKHPEFANGYGPRYALTVAISKNEGQDWQNKKYIQNIPGGVTMTPGATFVDDEVLVTFATQTRKLSEQQLYSVRLKIFPVDWFYKE